MMSKQFKNRLAEFISDRLGSVCTMLLVPAMMTTMYFASPVVALSINGEYVGTIESTLSFEQQIADLERSSTEILGKPYTLDIDKEYKLVYGSQDEPLTEDQIDRIISSHVDEIGTIAVINVNGEFLAAAQSSYVAKSALNEVLKEATDSSNASSAQFVENIEVVEQLGNVTLIQDKDAIKSLLTETEVAPAIHKVSEGETLSQIANSYDLNSAEVATLNPDISIDQMQIGQEIIIKKAQPAVAVEVVCEETYIEEIDFTTTTKYDDTMTTTQKKTNVVGVKGRNEIVASVTYVNGEEVSREIVSKTVLNETVNAVVTVGTQKPIATGKFLMPTKGATLTSPYGYRSSGFHSGIDLADSYGTSIYASDGGTVTFSGWNGAYGNCIIISHDNGFETLYAHASSLLVPVGAKVTQGDVIAKMGSTGRSTGNHLHFEIRVNGVHQNPYNYL